LDNLRAIFDEAESVSIEDLRKTVITFAVQGKLISQNPDDDSVDELLDKISNQNTLQKAIPKSRKLMLPETEPFNIPKSWRWIQLGQIANLIEYGTSYKADSNSKNIPIYRMGNIQNGNISDSNLKYVPPDIAELPKLYLEPRDILFNRTNSWELVGKAGIYKGSAQSHTFASYLIRIRLPNNHLEADFFNLCFLAPYFRATQIEPALTQQCGQANFNGTKLANSLFPLPPHNEQHRIVAKVDQLMALIDKLEEQQARKAKVAEAFAQAAVAAITGTEIKEPEKMKAPKTELVSRLQTRNKPNAADPAPLAKLLTDHNGELPAKTLWQRSGLEIDAFYQQLRTEMANGWIIEPEKAVMKEIEAD
jgi:type I restriction enzyme S subunit